MNSTSISLLFLSVSICIAALTGCSKPVAASQAMEPAKLPAAVNQAFDKAPDETKQQATTYLAALQGQDAPTAFAQLQKLSAENNLSPEQRRVVAKAMQTTVQQLQVAAQNGNPSAKAALHKYLSTR